MAWTWNWETLGGPTFSLEKIEIRLYLSFYFFEYVIHLPKPNEDLEEIKNKEGAANIFLYGDIFFAERNISKLNIVSRKPL